MNYLLIDKESANHFIWIERAWITKLVKINLWILLSRTVLCNTQFILLQLHSQIFEAATAIHMSTKKLAMWVVSWRNHGNNIEMHSRLLDLDEEFVCMNMDVVHILPLTLQLCDVASDKRLRLRQTKKFVINTHRTTSTCIDTWV